MITGTTLTSGLIGGVVGALGSFTAAALTIWRTRAGDRKREETRLGERDEERREAVVAEVIGAFRALEAEVRWFPVLAGRASAGMLQASMRFYLSERSRHPLVANWLLARQKDYDARVNRWRGGWWHLWARVRPHAIGEFLGQVIAVLVAWSVGDINDADFADAGRAPADFIPAITPSGESRSGRADVSGL